jgi:hypothetical protein
VRVLLARRAIGTIRSVYVDNPDQYSIKTSKLLRCLPESLQQKGCKKDGGIRIRADRVPTRDRRTRALHSLQNIDPIKGGCKVIIRFVTGLLKRDERLSDRHQLGFDW